MQRRKFIKDSGLVVIGVGVFGSIHWSDDHFAVDRPYQIKQEYSYFFLIKL